MSLYPVLTCVTVSSLLQIAAKIQPSGQKRPLEEGEGMDRLAGEHSVVTLFSVTGIQPGLLALVQPRLFTEILLWSYDTKLSSCVLLVEMFRIVIYRLSDIR